MTNGQKKENWKEIPGYEERYWVSSDGKIKSKYKGKEIILKTSKDKNGYIKVQLNQNGKIKSTTMHRLVALCYVPNPYNYNEVNHIDGNKENNNFTNLEWCSRSQNVQHAFDKHLKENKKGELSKLTKEFFQFDLNGNLIKKWKGIGVACEELGISDRRLITQCLHKRSKTCFGYIFSFDSEINLEEHKADYNSKKIIGTNISTGEEIEFDSVKDVTIIGINDSNVVKCLKGKRTTCGGYTWRYKN